MNGPVPAIAPKREVEDRSAADTSLPHRGRQPSGYAGGSPEVVVTASGPRCDVLPVCRDLHQFPKGKSGAVPNVKRAETEGSCYIAASNPVNGHVPVP